MQTISEYDTNGLKLKHVLLDMKSGKEMEIYYELFVKCFGERSNISVDTFQWYNLQQPGVENYSFGLMHDNVLVAAYGILPLDLYFDRQIIKGALCTNGMTHPDYGGKGLFTLIGKASLEYSKKLGLNIVIGIPNENAIKGHTKVGWHSMENVSFYQYEGNPNDINDENENFKIIPTEFEWSDFEFDDLYIPKYDTFFLRNVKWLQWRIRKPHCEYMQYKLTENGVFKGYMILKKYSDLKLNIKKLHIVDYAFQDNIHLSKLLQFAAKIKNEEGYSVLNLWNYKTDKTAEILKQNGFTESEQSNRVILFLLNENINLDLLGKFHLTLFDNDVF